MDLSWISLLLLTFVWPAAVHIYEPPTALWPFLIAAAALFSFLSFRRKGEVDRLTCGKGAATYCGLLLLAQGAVFPFYYIWAARSHAESFFASLADSVLNLFGVETVGEGNVLYVDSLLRTVVYGSAWEKVGAVYLVLFTVGGVVCLLMKKARFRHYAVFLSITFVYTLLRYVFLIMIYLTYLMHSIFWNRVLGFVTFIPYVLILTVVFRDLPLPQAGFLIKGYGKSKSVITGVLAALLVLSGVSFFGFRDMGKEKPGRVLVDEYHSDWEWTTEAYDESWFGERSGYNYYCFFNLLERYYETERNMGAIDSRTLDDVDVFIMKTPTKPFTQEEVAYMTAFVENGGGLYLIGDHTNVFGTGANLNQISKSFGITFNYDCTYELMHGSLSEYDIPKIMPHPSVSQLPHFLFATSNTLDAKWQAEEIMIGYGLKNLQADYSQKNFFPSDSNAANIEFGLFLQSVGVQHGKGRVLAFTDSTVYSNFWMFMPGKPELLLGSIEWLNRENTFTRMVPREISALCMGLMLLLNGVWIGRNRKKFPLAVLVLAGIVAFPVCSGLFQITANAQGRLPEPIRPMVNIRFEQEYSQYQLPEDLDGFMANMGDMLNTFYVWTQRLDYFPGVDEKLLDALENGDIAVMAKPGRQIKKTQQVMDAVADGGKLLILDNTESGACSNNLLLLAGMELVDAEIGEHADYEEIKDIPLTRQASAVTGGEAIITDDNGNALLSVVKVGDGLIAVFSDPDLFYNYELGDVSANLTEKTEILTNLEFKVLKELMWM